MKYREGSEKSYKTKIINYGKIIKEKITVRNYNDIINKYKANNIIPPHFGMSIATINKYFGNFNNFKLEIHNG